MLNATAHPAQAFICESSVGRSVPIFVSHSRRDELMVARVTRALSLLGKPFEAVVYENLPETAKAGPDWWNIDNLIRRFWLLLSKNGL